MVIYEQPLNERIRLFMRLEHIFHRYNYHISSPSAENIQSALVLLMDIHEMTARLDVKSAILKILDHQASVIKSFSESANEQVAQTEHIIATLEGQTKTLYGYHGQLGQHLKSHYFFNLVKQRAAISGGLNGFDVPVFNHWISQPLEVTTEDMQSWFKPYRKLEEAIHIVMGLIRSSAEFDDIVAMDGFYQTNLGNGTLSKNHQLLRVALSASSEFYPEISAGKQRFSIRFVDIGDLEERGIQIRDNIEFRLSICGF